MKVAQYEVLGNNAKRDIRFLSPSSLVILTMGDRPNCRFPALSAFAGAAGVFYRLLRRNPSK